MEFYLPFFSKFTASLTVSTASPPPRYSNSRNPPPYCAICLSDVRGGDRYRKLPECGHCFHALCIDAWFKSHSTCPLCRTQMIWVKEDHHDTGGEI
ncbi:UNVERIFIED_CONTAM: RING-H2 finger protein ATL60 [Sesamum angustifolium]|uniref:RING-H2 finger protein ATL60 n=1 Tax=Sesamum angustifolium TaxID=2727405 RepID=A0AAW2N9S7_9LAMI